MATQPSAISFSLSGVPEAGRLKVLKETLGPGLNFDFSALDEKIEFDVSGWMLPQVGFIHARHSALAAKRSDLSLQDDDFEFVWPAAPAKGLMQHRGGEVNGETGSAALLSRADPFTSAMDNGFQPVVLRIQRALLAPMLPAAEAALTRPVPRDQPAFRLLRSYLAFISGDNAHRGPEVAAAVSCHIADLVALAVGATRDASVLAAQRGVRVARLEAIKGWTRERLHQPRLSVVGAAAAQAVSTRYVQMLFETDGTTFSRFLLRERLQLARRLLAAESLTVRAISSVAFDAGFGDLSYFNRSFRAAFGETPTDFRHRSQAGETRG